MAETIKSRLAAWVQTVDREFTLGEAAKQYVKFGGSNVGPCESVLGAVSHMLRCVKKGPKGGVTTSAAVYRFDPQKLADWNRREAEHKVQMAKYEAQREADSIWHRIVW